MSKLTTLGLLAFACCATLTVATGMMGTNMMYNPYMGGMGMMQGVGMKGAMMRPPMYMPMPVYGGAGGGQGFSPVGQGGIMQFFFMLIFLMFMMSIFQDFGNNNGGDHYKK